MPTTDLVIGASVLGGGLGLMLLRSSSARHAAGRGLAAGLRGARHVSSAAGNAALLGAARHWPQRFPGRGLADTITAAGGPGSISCPRGCGVSWPEGSRASELLQHLTGCPGRSASPPRDASPGPATTRPPAQTPPEPAAPTAPPLVDLTHGGGGAFVDPAASVRERIDRITEHLGAAMDEFRRLMGALRAIGDIEIDPKDPEAVEQFIGYLHGSAAALLAFAGNLTNMAEQADNVLRLDPRVTRHLYAVAEELSEASARPTTTWRALEQLYEAQLAQMRGQTGVRPPAPGLFDRQPA